MISLCIIKPDAVARGLTGIILSSIEAADFKITNLKLYHLSEHEVNYLYRHHAGTDYFPRIVESMVRGPVILAAVTGVGFREHALRLRRQFQGPSKNSAENVIHASGSATEGLDEVRLFFPGNSNEVQSAGSEHGPRKSDPGCGHPVLSA